MASRLGLSARPADCPPGGPGSSPDFLSFDPPPCVQLGRRDDLRGDVGGRGGAWRAPAACSWARITAPSPPIVQSGPSATSASARNASRILARVPSPDQRRCRLYTVFQLPNAGGTS